MLRLRTPLALCAAAATLAAIPGTTPAAGTIDTTGATIAAGAAPTQGIVTIDPAAAQVAPPALPANDPLGSLGAMPGSIPAFNGTGGGASIVIGPPGAVLAGGTYSCTTYTVAQGAIVVYGGPVTIQASGNVQIDGLVSTTAAGAAVSIVCGGTFQIRSHTGTFSTGISTAGAASPISIDAAGFVKADSADTSGSAISAASGQVTVISHDASSLLSLQNITILSQSGGDAVVQSAQGLALLTAFVQANGGSATAQAFGTGAVLQSGAVLGANNALLESAGGVTMTAASTVAGANSVGVAAYGGDVTLTSSTIVQSGGTGDVTVRASGNVALRTTSSVLCQGAGMATLTAFGGTATIEQAGATTTSTVRTFGAGDASVLASGDVRVAAASTVRADQGAVRVRSAGGSVLLSGDCTLDAPNGAVDVRAGGGFGADQDASAFPGAFPALQGTSLLVSAGAGGIAATCDPVTTQSGPIALVTSGDVTVASDLTANGPLTVQSTQGDVTVAGHTLVTGSVGNKSGDVRIECFAGNGAKIDASNASVRSGDHATESGDVTLAVHAPAAPPSTDGALVPAKIQLKSQRHSSVKRLVASGVLDLGSGSVLLLGVTTLKVGDLSFTFIIGTDKRGRAVYASDDLTLRIVPSKLGTSRAAFSLSVAGDFSGFLDAGGSGTVAIEFERSLFKARGAAEVTDGKFLVGKGPGRIVEPDFRVAKAHGVLKDGAADKLDLDLGFLPPDPAPATAPEVTVAFGGTFSVTVPASAFSNAGGGAFVARDPEHGVKLLVVDYASGTVVFRGRKIELGALGSGATLPVSCTLSLGAATHTYAFRMAHRGSALLY